MFPKWSGFSCHTLDHSNGWFPSFDGKYNGAVGGDWVADVSSEGLDGGKISKEERKRCITEIIKNDRHMNLHQNNKS